MANVNTLAAVYGLAGPTSASETAIQFPVGYLGPSGASTSGTPLRAVVGVPANSGVVDGHPFKIRVTSKYVASGAGNFTLNLYWNSKANTNLTTFTSDILLAGTGTLAMATSSGVVDFEVVGSWDSVSGRFAAMWNEAAGLSNIVTTPAIIKTSAAVTSQNPITAAGITSSDLLQFFVTHTCSANTTSTTLVELSVSQV